MDDIFIKLKMRPQFKSVRGVFTTSTKLSTQEVVVCMKSDVLCFVAKLSNLKLKAERFTCLWRRPSANVIKLFWGCHCSNGYSYLGHSRIHCTKLVSYNRRAHIGAGKQLS